MTAHLTTNQRLLDSARAALNRIDAAPQAHRTILLGFICDTIREIAAAMLFELHRRGLGEAYGPIVTVHGEVLHMEAHDGPIAPGDLLLADVGGEAPEGWAADITRVWPVSGTFSATQRAIYVDGELASAVDPMPAGPTGWESGYKLALGSELSGVNPWLGRVALVAIYDRALASDEIRRNFTAGMSAPAP